MNRIDKNIYIYIFGPEQAIQANPFASQSKLKLALTRLPFVKSGHVQSVRCLAVLDLLVIDS